MKTATNTTNDAARDAGQITLNPPCGNGRRDYGIQFRVNGELVPAPRVVKDGDHVVAEYLGGNQWQTGAEAAIAAIIARGGAGVGKGRGRTWEANF